MVYVPGVEAVRSITPVAPLIESPAGAALNVPPVAPVGDGLTVTVSCAVVAQVEPVGVNV
jgi:hypothetical protein